MHKATAGPESLVLFPKQTLVFMGKFSFSFALPFLFQSSLFPLSHPSGQGGELRDCCQCGKYGLWPSGGQAQQRHQCHGRGHERQPSAAQVPVYLWRSELALVSRSGREESVPALLDYRRSKCIRKSCLLMCLDWKCCTQLHVWVSR